MAVISAPGRWRRRLPRRASSGPSRVQRRRPPRSGSQVGELLVGLGRRPSAAPRRPRRTRRHLPASRPPRPRHPAPRRPRTGWRPGPPGRRPLLASYAHTCLSSCWTRASTSCPDLPLDGSSPPAVSARSAFSLATMAGSSRCGDCPMRSSGRPSAPRRTGVDARSHALGETLLPRAGQQLAGQSARGGASSFAWTAGPRCLRCMCYSLCPATVRHLEPPTIAAEQTTGAAYADVAE